MASVVLSHVTKRYAAARALDDVGLDVASGEFVTLLGPSGCGKSTTLRAVAGLAAIDAGTVRIDGRDVTALPTAKRNIGMVFQNLALFPHMTVAANIAFGLRMRGLDAAEQRRRVAEALALVRLDGMAERYPHQLSGGQQQRVAIARALVVNPTVLLLDEPFAALDRKLREAMQVELRELTRRIGMTALFVTHDQEEALTLSDRIAVMNAGRIDQVGAPAEVYEAPTTRFVADFMGIANIVDVTVETIASTAVRLRWDGMVLEAAPSQRWPAAGPVAIGLRPERIALQPGPNAVRGTVRSVIYQGAFTSLEIEPAHRPGTRLKVRSAGLPPATSARLAVGDPVTASFTPDAVIPLHAAAATA
ncbi:MAG: ABC transporter ATP-binding protein [Alphaproteobacteria bacterium]|nr:ABC transporter ATP-binding protein [Alphaproteobacteria bacterium]